MTRDEALEVARGITTKLVGERAHESLKIAHSEIIAQALLDAVQAEQERCAALIECLGRGNAFAQVDVVVETIRSRGEANDK